MKGGGPAFPRPLSTFTAPDDSNYTAIEQEGMTLRDYFAGQALVGLVANRDPEDPSPGLAAVWAYLYADAMLAERDK